MENRYIIYKKNGVFNKKQGACHSSCFIGKTDEEAITENSISGFEAEIVDEETFKELMLQEDVEDVKKNKISQCQTYLEGTDWQAAAFIKYGRPVDANVSENCLKAKQWKIDIAACTTLEELNAININFN